MNNTGYHDFPRKIFSLRMSTNIVGKTVLCFRSFLIWKNFIDRSGWGGVYREFLTKIFRVTVPKKFRSGTLLCFANLLVSKKFLHRRRSSVFRPKILSHTNKNFLGVTLVFQNCSGMEEING